MGRSKEISLTQEAGGGRTKRLAGLDTVSNSFKVYRGGLK